MHMRTMQYSLCSTGLRPKKHSTRILNVKQGTTCANKQSNFGKGENENENKKIGSSGASDRKNENETKIERMNELILSKHTPFFLHPTKYAQRINQTWNISE